jgi:hypothetical protein
VISNQEPRVKGQHAPRRIFLIGHEREMSPGWKYVKAIAFTGVVLAAGAGLSTAQAVRPGAPRAIGFGPAPGGGRTPTAMAMALANASISFPFISGSATNPGSAPLTVTISWNCNCNNVSLYAYFSSSTTALSDGAGDNIPSAAFSLSDNGGPFRALNTTVPFGGPNAGLRVVQILNPASSGSHADTMNFNINLSTGTLPALPPGTYTGTLTLQAQAQ